VPLDTWVADTSVPQRHRTDRMSLAVNNASDEKEFKERYTGLLGYYGMEMEKIQAEEPNENGDAEHSLRRLKEAVEQALLLRGSRDFESREPYGRFLQELVAARNAVAENGWTKSWPRLRGLPERRRESYKRLSVPVDRGSLIHVDRNADGERRFVWSVTTRHHELRCLVSRSGAGPRGVIQFRSLSPSRSAMVVRAIQIARAA
jgi:hypothetical protein